MGEVVYGIDFKRKKSIETLEDMVAWIWDQIIIPRPEKEKTDERQCD